MERREPWFAVTEKFRAFVNFSLSGNNAEVCGMNLREIGK